MTSDAAMVTADDVGILVEILLVIPRRNKMCTAVHGPKTNAPKMNYEVSCSQQEHGCERERVVQKR